MKRKFIIKLIGIALMGTITISGIPSTIVEADVIEHVTYEQKNIDVEDTVPIGLWEGSEALKKEVCFRSGKENIEEVTYADLKNITQLKVSKTTYSNVPDIIKSFENLEELEVSGYIKEVPDWIGDFSKLKVLFFNNTDISSLPEGISNLSNLEVLRINSALLSDVPKVIYSLNNLKVLELVNCNLTSLDDEITNLSKLQELNLSHNEFGDIPNVLLNLKSLQYLDLTNTKLVSIPDKLNDSSISKINLSSNQLIQVPDLPGKELIYNYNFIFSDGNENLLELTENIFKVEIGEIISPENLKKLVKVRTKINGESKVLDLDDRHSLEIIIDGRLVSFEELANYKEGVYKAKVKVKGVDDNPFTIGKQTFKLLIGDVEDTSKNEETEVVIPDDATGSIPVEYWQNCRPLMDYVCEYLKIQDIKSVTFEDLATIKTVVLEESNISSLPVIIKKFISLEQLEIRESKLESIPKEIYELKNLKSLGFYSNVGFNKLPKELLKLENLSELTFWNCGIVDVDKKLSNLKIKSISLSKNPISEEAAKIVGEMEYLESIKLVDCKLTKLPDNFSRLNFLQTLIVTDNQLVNIPKMKNPEIIIYNEQNLMSVIYTEVDGISKYVLFKEGMDKINLEIKQGVIPEQKILRDMIKVKACYDTNNSEYKFEEVYENHSLEFVIDDQVLTPEEVSLLESGNYKAKIKIRDAAIDNTFAITNDTVSIKVIANKDLAIDETNSKILPYTGGVSSITTILFGSGLIAAGVIMAKKKKNK